MKEKLVALLLAKALPEPMTQQEAEAVAERLFGWWLETIEEPEIWYALQQVRFSDRVVESDFSEPTDKK